MIKNILKWILLATVSMILSLNKQTKDVKNKLDSFFNDVEANCINYFIDEELHLVFDYELLEEVAQTTFLEYETIIKKESESAFTIIVIIKEKFLINEIKERIYLRKGDLYV